MCMVQITLCSLLLLIKAANSWLGKKGGDKINVVLHKRAQARLSSWPPRKANALAGHRWNYKNEEERAPWTRWSVCPGGRAPWWQQPAKFHVCVEMWGRQAWHRDTGAGDLPLPLAAWPWASSTLFSELLFLCMKSKETDFFPLTSS